MNHVIEFRVILLNFHFLFVHISFHKSLSKFKKFLLIRRRPVWCRYLPYKQNNLNTMLDGINKITIDKKENFTKTNPYIILVFF